jgi:hypothetical protein
MSINPTTTYYFESRRVLRTALSKQRKALLLLDAYEHAQRAASGKPLKMVSIMFRNDMENLGA